MPTSKLYHVNPATGKIGTCRAAVQCPFGGPEKHFTNREAANDYAEALLAAPASLKGQTKKAMNEEAKTTKDLEKLSTFIREGSERTFKNLLKNPNLLPEQRAAILERTKEMDTAIAIVRGENFGDTVLEKMTPEVFAEAAYRTVNSAFYPKPKGGFGPSGGAFFLDSKSVGNAHYEAFKKKIDEHENDDRWSHNSYNERNVLYGLLVKDNSLTPEFVDSVLRGPQGKAAVGYLDASSIARGIDNGKLSPAILNDNSNNILLSLRYFPRAPLSSRSRDAFVAAAATNESRELASALLNRSELTSENLDTLKDIAPAKIYGHPKATPSIRSYIEKNYGNEPLVHAKVKERELGREKLASVVVKTEEQDLGAYRILHTKTVRVDKGLMKKYGITSTDAVQFWGGPMGGVYDEEKGEVRSEYDSGD